jgi:hypothetical protein
VRDALTEVLGGTWRVRARAATAATPPHNRSSGETSEPAAGPAAGSGSAADLPSADDADMPEAGSGGAHDPVALLAQGLGAKVIDERDAG